jgi:hypothetical protein
MLIDYCTTQWDIMIAQRSDSNIVAIQSALLGQTFGLLMGVCPLPVTLSSSSTI